MTAGHTIDVYCAEPSHAERRWEVMRYKQTGSGDWQSSNLKFKSQQRQQLGEVITQSWFEDEKRYRSLGEAVPEGARVRERPKLNCGVCRMAFERTDTTVLYAILDKLAAAGQAEISVRMLNVIADSIGN